MDPSRGENFFKHMPTHSVGTWIHESLCLQQGHAHVFKKPTVLGFPWLSLGELYNNEKALKGLREIKKLPKDSVKVIRYRRNILDMISRQEKHLIELKEKQATGAVTLDHKKLDQSFFCQKG